MERSPSFCSGISGERSDLPRGVPCFDPRCIRDPPVDFFGGFAVREFNSFQLIGELSLEIVVIFKLGLKLSNFLCKWLALVTLSCVCPGVARSLKVVEF